MKKKIKIYLINPEYKLEQHGNWIDLKTRIVTHLTVDECFKLIPLNMHTELPKWYKAEAKPRSSTYKNFNILLANSLGEIEANYGGEWVFPALFIPSKRGIVGTDIPEGVRICQACFKLREDAPWYMKILDLFTKLEIEYVNRFEDLKSTRGGLGSTGT